MPSLLTMNNNNNNKNQLQQQQQSQQINSSKRMKHLFLIFLKQFQVDEYKQLINFLQITIDKYNLNPSKLFGFLTSQEDLIDSSKQENKQHDSSQFRRNLRNNSAKLAANFIQKKLNNSLIINGSTKNKPETSSKAMLEMLANRNDIIDSFVMKETDNKQEIDDYEEEDYWNETNNNNNTQFYPSDESISDKALADNSQTNGNSNKSTRIRKFSDKIRNELERSFLANNFITGGEKQILAKKLNLTERQVSKWFVHRREKLRRLEKRATNINSTLHHHYMTQQQNHNHQVQSIQDQQNDNYQEQEQEQLYVNDSNQDYNDENEEENWFNELQVEDEHHHHQQQQDDTNQYDENFDDYHSSTETYNSDEFNTNNKRLSHDPQTSAKRQCLSAVSSSSLSSRRLFPPEVVSHLETIFDTEKYLKDDQVAEISNATNLSDKQIRSWFKQRRYRYNQENKQNGIDIEIKKYNNLSQQVVNELEKSFRINNYVYGNDKKVLARKLNLTPVQLERWFYYRRKKQSNGTANSNNVINETF